MQKKIQQINNMIDHPRYSNIISDDISGLLSRISGTSFGLELGTTIRDHNQGPQDFYKETKKQRHNQRNSVETLMTDEEKHDLEYNITF